MQYQSCAVELRDTQVSDAGLKELRKALPQAYIYTCKCWIGDVWWFRDWDPEKLYQQDVRVRRKRMQFPSSQPDPQEDAIDEIERLGRFNFVALEKTWRLVDCVGTMAGTHGGLAKLTPDDTDAVLSQLKKLRNLKWLTLYDSQMTDAQMARLEELPELRELEIICREGISDVGLATLRRLKGLRVLYLRDQTITAVGLGHLKRLTQLRWLHVDREMASEDVKSLRQALPNCTIEMR